MTCGGSWCQRLGINWINSQRPKWWYLLIAGWWFGTFFCISIFFVIGKLVGGLVAIFGIFPEILGIIPIDELIFFRGVAKNHQPVSIDCHWKSCEGKLRYVILTFMKISIPMKRWFFRMSFQQVDWPLGLKRRILSGHSADMDFPAESKVPGMCSPCLPFYVLMIFGYIKKNIWLVVTGCHGFGIFPEILGVIHHPNWRTHIFQRGG